MDVYAKLVLLKNHQFVNQQTTKTIIDLRSLLFRYLFFIILMGQSNVDQIKYLMEQHATVALGLSVIIMEIVSLKFNAHKIVKSSMVNAFVIMATEC